METDAQRDWRAEDRAGADADGCAAYDAENDPRCEWCDLAVEDVASVFAPYCSAECEREAELGAALEEAAHQAARSRTNEPHRWPNG